MIGDYIVALLTLALVHIGLSELIGIGGTIEFITRVVIGGIIWVWMTDLIRRKYR